MAKGIRFALQALNYSVFMALVGYFSFAPPHRQLEENQAVIALAFGHAGQRIEECRHLTPEELAELPPNMRKLDDCPRERSPITVELLLDGKLAVREVAQAPGLYSDQGVDIYHSVKIPAGDHHLTVQMNDSVRVQGFTHQHEQTVTLVPEQLLVVEFQPDHDRFVVR